VILSAPRSRVPVLPSWSGRVVGIGLVVVAWYVLAVTLLESSRVVPTPLDVLRQLWDDRDSYPANIRTTLREAMLGYVWGNAAAIALGLLFELIPPVEGPLLRISIASFNIPLVAIAPILVVTLSGDGPKAALAALAVFFTTLIATMVGLRSADRTALDVVRAYGGGRGAALRKVKLWAALPSIFAGLRVAAPAALLGAIIGEYLGASEGLGVAMIQAQSSFQVAGTWALALVVSALAGALYLAATGLARLLTPWAGETNLALSIAAPPRPAGGRLARIVRPIGFFALSVLVLILTWDLLLRAFELNPFFAKSPEAVYRFLMTDPRAADHRATLLDALGQTLRDAAPGYILGLAAASLTAIVVVLSPAIEQTIMPVAIAVRSVPLVALTPLIALLFGRGFWGVTVVVTLVTFFPTLVNVTVGLRSAPALACELVAVAGGGRLMEMWKVRLPYALPALFASAKIAAPAAIGGATLAEWLATGKGLGSLLVISYSASDFNTLWSGAALIVAVSIGLYSLVGAIEGLVLTRMRG
jgi:sulfonate transport system permease protein